MFRSKEERRRIVEETLKPGAASVAVVARANGVNANEILAWRRMYRNGGLETDTSAALLPVKIADAVALPTQRRGKSKPVRRGIIDIDLGYARVRIEGAADLDSIRSTSESLLR